MGGWPNLASTPNPHHILHKYQADTASAWPFPGDVVSRKPSFDRHT